MGVTTAAVVGKTTGNWISTNRNKEKEAEAIAAETATQGRLDDVFDAMRPQISPTEAAARVDQSTGKIQRWLETDGGVVVLGKSEYKIRTKAQWDLLEALTVIGAPREQSSGTYRTGNDSQGIGIDATVDTRVMDPNADPTVLRAPILKTSLTYHDTDPEHGSASISIGTSRKAGVRKPEAYNQLERLVAIGDWDHPVNKEQRVAVMLAIDGSAVMIELSATGSSYDTFNEVPGDTDFTIQISVDGKPVEEPVQQAGLLGQLPNAINAVAARLDDHIEAGGEW